MYWPGAEGVFKCRPKESKHALKSENNRHPHRYCPVGSSKIAHTVKNKSLPDVLNGRTRVKRIMMQWGMKLFTEGNIFQMGDSDLLDLWRSVCAFTRLCADVGHLCLYLVRGAGVCLLPPAACLSDCLPSCLSLYPVILTRYSLFS